MTNTEEIIIDEEFVKKHRPPIDKELNRISQEFQLLSGRINQMQQKQLQLQQLAAVENGVWRGKVEMYLDQKGIDHDSNLVELIAVNKVKVTRKEDDRVKSIKSGKSEKSDSGKTNSK